MDHVSVRRQTLLLHEGALDNVNPDAVWRPDVTVACIVRRGTRFLLVEIYRAPEAQAAHRETEHYKTWRDTVADMMAEPRVATKYASVFPETL